MSNNLLFSVTKKDLKISWFSGTGKGGQHRNKHQNCVRIQHPSSGATVTGQSNKSRQSNIREALKNLIRHPKFILWHNRVVNEMCEEITVDEKVEEMMQPDNLKIEVKEGSKWVKEQTRNLE